MLKTERRREKAALSGPQSEGFGREAVYQNAGGGAVKQAENDRHDPERHGRHPQLCQGKAGEIGRRQNQLVCAAFQLGPRGVRLEQVVDRQIVDREEQAHAQDGNDQHRVVQRIVRPAGGKQDQRQPRADHQRRDRVDLHDLTQADLKQPQDKAGPLVKGVGQQAVVAVHKKRLGKARAAVDGVHDKHKVRQPGQHDLVDGGFCLWQQADRRQHGGDEEGAHAGDLLGRVPEYLLVPFDKQLVQVLKAPAAAGDGSIRGYVLFVCLLDELCAGRAVHLIGQARQQLFVDGVILAEGGQPGDACHAQRDARQEYPHRHGGGKGKTKGGRGIGGGQKQGDNAPHIFGQPVFVVAKAPFLIVPQGERRRKQLHARYAKGQEQTKPQRYASIHTEQNGKGHKADNDLQYGVEIVYQRILPRVHPHQDHRIVLVLRRVEKVGVRKAADHREKQQDVQERLILRQPFIKGTDTAYQRDKVKELAQERGRDLPQHRQNVRKDFQALYLIQRRREQPL